MNYRHYEQKDESKVVELWNRTITFDILNEEKFRKQAILDENFDENLTWVALDGDKIVGFVYATKRKFPYLERGLEPEKGWINVIFVDPDYERQGIGSTLLENCEQALLKTGTKTIITGAYSPNYFFWGVDTKHYPKAVNFLKKHGYEQGPEHFGMGMNLHGYQIPDAIKEKKKTAEAKGYKFVHFSNEYTLDLLKFLRDEFGGGWKRNALLAMQKGVAEDVLMIVLDKDDNIVGCCNRAIDGNPMRFGPIGVCEAARNGGIGTILLDCVLLDMCKKGIYRMFFVTTEENGRRYYERQGLSVIRTTTEFNKNV